jgi:glutathione peroxidase
MSSSRVFDVGEFLMIRSSGVLIVTGVVVALYSIGCSDADDPAESTVRETTMNEEQPVLDVGLDDHAPGVVDHRVTSIEGDTVDLRGYRGRPMLIVNTASKCGFTKQYETLQKLYEEFGHRGFVIIGFPSNDFGNQEPGTREEIADFCRLTFGVTFPLMEKVHTKGPDQAPIYHTLTTESPEAMQGEIKWNFTKFLINGDGKVVARFEPAVDPMSDEIVAAVEGLFNGQG